MSGVAARFLTAAQGWVCDEYFADIRYLGRGGLASELWSALVQFSPLPAGKDEGFEISNRHFVAGRAQIGPISKTSAMRILNEISRGSLKIGAASHELSPRGGITHISELDQRGKWYRNLHLSVSTRDSPRLSAEELSAFDDLLRNASPPFDGLHDLCAHLGLQSIDAEDFKPTISVHVGPPIDMLWDGTEFSSDGLKLKFEAHSAFDVSRASVAVRFAPSNSISSRYQAADRIDWKLHVGDRKLGEARLACEGTYSAIAMLSIEGVTVRRQWYSNTSGSSNLRHMVVQHYDKELKRLKRALLDDADPKEFEKAVAALAFILGFSPALQIESDAPDVVLLTPSGRLVIVECTLRVSDIATKVGKLVDRKLTLVAQLHAANERPEVIPILVCRQSSDQLNADKELLAVRGVSLVTREGLEDALLRVRGSADADLLLNEIVGTR